MPSFVSLVIPIYNEQDNIKLLHNKIVEALKPANINYEIIYIDDGSIDNSYNELLDIKDSETKIIKFRKNFGQTCAMQAGINHSKGDVIITLDADLQNDPNDIPKLLEVYDKGYDLVSGWRKKRQDNITRTFPSKIANYIISSLTKTYLKDTGCTLKAYNANILRKINLFADHHRFIPAIFTEYSSNIAEVEVEHHSRMYGKSKYNILRVFKVIVDLAAILYWKNYRNRPMYFWGNLSIIMISFSMLTLVLFAVMLFKSFVSYLYIILPVMSVVFLCTGIILFAVGLLFESNLRILLEYNKEKIYEIEKIL